MGPQGGYFSNNGKFHPRLLFQVISTEAIMADLARFGVSMDELMRLRFNPFFAYLEARVKAELAAL